MNQNEAWRLISCIWLHAGVIHLLVNMLSLMFIGIRLERQFGFGRNLKCPRNLKRQFNHILYTSWIFICSLLIKFCLFYAVRVGVIYLLSGIGGSVLSALFIHRSISVGASGALFGLLGAMLAELLTNWTIYTNKVRSEVVLFLHQPHCQVLLDLLCLKERYNGIEPLVICPRTKILQITSNI